jgi:hypothetical protein
VLNNDCLGGGGSPAEPRRGARPSDGRWTTTRTPAPVAGTLSGWRASQTPWATDSRAPRGGARGLCQPSI